MHAGDEPTNYPLSFTVAIIGIAIIFTDRRQYMGLFNRIAMLTGAMVAAITGRSKDTPAFSLGRKTTNRKTTNMHPPAPFKVRVYGNPARVSEKKRRPSWLRDLLMEKAQRKRYTRRERNLYRLSSINDPLLIMLVSSRAAAH